MARGGTEAERRWRSERLSKTYAVRVAVICARCAVRRICLDKPTQEHTYRFKMFFRQQIGGKINRISTTIAETLQKYMPPRLWFVLTLARPFVQEPPNDCNGSKT